MVTTISVFNQVTNANSEDVSTTFTSGVGFYLISPTITDEIEIDIFLQVRVTATVTRMVRLEPLNLSTTERITVIPQQLRSLGLPMYLSIFSSEAVLLEVLLLQPTHSLATIGTELTIVNQKLDSLTAKVDSIDASVDLVLADLGIPAPVTRSAITSRTQFNQLQILGVI